MNRYQQIIGKINYGLFLAVVALLPFPQITLRYACVLWLISWVLEGRWLTKPQSLRTNTMAIPFILFGLWYAWKGISGLWSPDHAAWSWQMERYMTFGFIVPVGIWGVNQYYNWQTIGKVFVACCVAAVPLYLIWMTLLQTHPEWVPYLHLQEEWFHHTDWWQFVAENISHFKHRLFLCSVEIIGAVIALQLWRKRLSILVPSLVIMLSTIPLTGSRQSFLSVVVLGVLIILFALPQKRRLTYSIGIIVIGALVGTAVVKFHPRMQDVHLSDFTEMRTLSYNHDLRYNVWGAALQHPSDYLLHGLGAGQSTRYLVDRYEEVHFDYYAHMRIHAHNQYLEELMEIGIGGLLLFILAWISIPLCAKGKGRQTAVLFTTLFMLNMFTDCMFGKFCGIALWAAGMVFILLQSHTECEEQTSRNTETH